MNSELLASLLPTITSVAAIIVAVISFIAKVKSIVGTTTVENIKLKKELLELKNELKVQATSNNELKEELKHVLNRINKIKEK